ncbi:Restriction endonuclease S subunits [Brachyspira pilosicoli WesB]|uniref:Restriction endonuclease S subunits n=1 Tax=Brachyspira pilosicoli WesB TaxID=1161918 RepID=K0JLS5_BRAPL|nr:restriction endonuclease subunit S [Brachyspira pilosicoli]CCG57385.1 Restriction endonuclease S subunits [Brachyspira pilosicoli WesB]
MKKELPSDWKEVRLGDICDINVNSLRESTNENYQFKYIDLSSVKNGIIDFPNNYITFKNAPSRARRIIKIDDVIMATVRPNLKGFAYISFDPKEYICSTGFAVLTSKSEICMKYIYQILYANYIEKQISNMLVGSNYPALNTSDILNIKILLPPLYEQKRIAEILSTFDDLIENLTKLIEKKEIYKKGVMQRVLSGEVRFEGFTDEWEFKSLEELCNIKKGEQKNKLDLIENGEYPVLSGGMDFSGYYDSYNREANTITISEGGNSCGYVNFIKTKFWASGHCYTLHDVNIDVAFLYQCLKYNENKIMKLRLGSGLPNIQLSYIREYTLKIPPSIEEQKKIAELLSLIDQDIDSLKQILHLRRLQKKGVMQKLLTGEVRV